MNIEVFDILFIIAWLLQSILYNLSFASQTSCRKDFIFILLSIKYVWKTVHIYPDQLKAWVAVVIIGLLVYFVWYCFILAPISLPGCLHVRKDAINLFGINRSRTLLFSKKFFMEYGKPRRYEDNVLYGNYSFKIRANRVLTHMINSNYNTTSVFDMDWNIEVLNDTVRNGLVQIAYENSKHNFCFILLYLGNVAKMPLIILEYKSSRFDKQT